MRAHMSLHALPCSLTPIQQCHCHSASTVQDTAAAGSQETASTAIRRSRTHVSHPFKPATPKAFHHHRRATPAETVSLLPRSAAEHAATTPARPQQAPHRRRPRVRLAAPSANNCSRPCTIRCAPHACATMKPPPQPAHRLLRQLDHPAHGIRRHDAAPGRTASEASPFNS